MKLQQMRIVAKLFNRRNRKGDTTLSPFGPVELTSDDHPDDEDSEGDYDSEDESYIESNDCTMRDAARESMFAFLTCADVYYEQDFAETLESVNQDLSNVLAERSILDKTMAEEDSSTDSETATHEDPYEESDPTENDKVIRVSDWNEPAEDHEVTTDEFMNDASAKKSGNSLENNPSESERVSDWNELAEEHEVTRDEFMRDMSAKQSGNSFLKRYRKYSP